jgi:hypothetical protein
MAIGMEQVEKLAGAALDAAEVQIDKLLLYAIKDDPVRQSYTIDVASVGRKLMTALIPRYLAAGWTKIAEEKVGHYVYFKFEHNLEFSNMTSLLEVKDTNRKEVNSEETLRKLKI